MPELPEVETVVRRLAKTLPGLEILDVNVHWQRSIACPKAASFKKQLIGDSIRSLSRRGKYIVMQTNKGRFLLAHLRMSGDLLHQRSSQPCSKHVRVKLCFANGSELRFDDTRKFGRMYLVDTVLDITKKLGPEPFDPLLSAEEFYLRLRQRRGNIKSLLLDQSFLAGLGNIYVVESLWRSRIHPLRKACRIKRDEAALLLRNIRSILDKAIRHNGTDIGDGVWKAGEFKTKAYGQQGKRCQRCPTLIKRIVIGQRGTEFCPKCQR